MFFPQVLSFSYFFDLFTRHQHCLRLFGGLYFLYFFSFWVFLFCPSTKTFLIALKLRAFSWEVSVPVICDPWPLFQNAFLVPSGPPRAVEAETVNSSAVRVKWRAPAPERQHGQIRGYQVHYVRMNYGEPQGQPFIKDILIEDSQVSLLLLEVITYSCMTDEIQVLHKQWPRMSGWHARPDLSQRFLTRRYNNQARYRQI